MTDTGAYLFTWNPTKYHWEDFDEYVAAVSRGDRPRRTWSCGNTKKIEVGDRLFMMRPGVRAPYHGIFASGTVIREPHKGLHWDEERPHDMILYVELI